MHCAIQWEIVFVWVIHQLIQLLITIAIDVVILNDLEAKETCLSKKGTCLSGNDFDLEAIANEIFSWENYACLMKCVHA